MRALFLSLFFTLCIVVQASSQQSVVYPTSVMYPIKHDTSPPLRSMRMIPPSKEAGEEREIPNHFFFFQNGRPNSIVGVGKDTDPVIQREPGRVSPFSTIANFDGITNLCGCYPPDPNADIGPNHVLETVNTSFAIYSKTGAILLGPASLSTLWTGFPGPWTGASDGDPVVRYDHLANRWLVSQFFISTGSPFYELVAVSQTADPLGSWHRYAFSFTNFNDYPKIGLWPDGYYMTANMFDPTGTTYLGPGVAVLQRDSMLVGAVAQLVFFQLSPVRGPMLPSDLDGAPPVAGTPNTFIELDLSTMNVRTLSVNWVATPPATLSGPTAIPVAAWTDLCPVTRNCVPQPSTTVKLDGIGDRLMNRLQYRSFGTYKVLMASHSVSAGGQAAVRWYEFRNTGSGWTVYQQGTYAPDANHRWMGSIAMNGWGDIALGYSKSSSTVFPSIVNTGRVATDALGTMTFAEQTIMAGTGSQTGTASRWGDYTVMVVDPVDDQTFWYTNEYLATTGQTPWRTRIASFKIADHPLPIQLASFTGIILNEGRVRLDWGTLSEINNYGFYVERRSNDRTYFEELPGSFVPGHGTTNIPQRYSFTDNAATPDARFYRLRQVDLDGTIHFTEPIAVNNLTGVQEPGPKEFTLQQNYPNPFNPSTEIKFSVETAGRATLETFNVLGQKVSTLFDDLAEPGKYYKVRFDGANLPSGMYVFKLESGTKIQMRKMLLLK